MDMQKIPPIQQKRIVTFVNCFIIDTVSFLNKFINSSEDSLWKLEKRMRKLETSLKLLERKLSCIPDIHDSASGDTKETEVTKPEAESEKTVTEISSEETEQKNEEEKVNHECVEQSEAAEKTVPPELQKYYKMMQVGVPIDGVKLKMQLDGFNPDLLKPL